MGRYFEATQCCLSKPSALMRRDAVPFQFDTERCREISAMVPIPPEFLESCVYVYRSKYDAENGVPDGGGTGFAVGVVLKNNTDFYQLYIVTCRHVIEGMTSPTIRVNLRPPPPAHTAESSECFETNGARWIFHPEGDDLAVLPFELERAHYGFNPILTSSFIRENDPRIWCGDETFMVGRFVGNDGKQTNTPTVRFGNLSMIPQAAVQNEQQPFLVEHRSLPGYSGSPVFVTVDPNSPKPPMWLTPFAAVYRQESHGPWFLGIDSYHVHNYEKVLLKDRKTPATPEQFVKANAGMAGIVPAWRLLSLLNCDELEQQRAKEDESITENKVGAER